MSLNITYASDREAIFKVGIVMQRKWDWLTSNRIDKLNIKSQKNASLMQEWADECKKRYEDIGFKVVVDITPAMADISPPTISIEDRITPELTDHERISHEIRQEDNK